MLTYVNSSVCLCYKLIRAKTWQRGAGTLIRTLRGRFNMQRIMDGATKIQGHPLMRGEDYSARCILEMDISYPFGQRQETR